MVDIFCGIMAGSKYANNVRRWGFATDGSNPADLGQESVRNKSFFLILYLRVIGRILNFRSIIVLDGLISKLDKNIVLTVPPLIYDILKRTH